VDPDPLRTEQAAQFVEGAGGQLLVVARRRAHQLELDVGGAAVGRGDRLHQL